MTWLWLSAGAMTASALVHSLGGGRRLMRPLLAIHQGILANDLSRQMFRFAWHATAVLMLLSAATVAWPGTPHGLILLIGTLWVATGLANAILTRGHHVIWAFLAVSGILAVIGAAG